MAQPELELELEWAVGCKEFLGQASPGPLVRLATVVFGAGSVMGVPGASYTGPQTVTRVVQVMGNQGASHTGRPFGVAVRVGSGLG